MFSVFLSLSSRYTVIVLFCFCFFYFGWPRTNSATSSNLFGVPSGKLLTANKNELKSSSSTTIAHIFLLHFSAITNHLWQIVPQVGKWVGFVRFLIIIFILFFYFFYFSSLFNTVNWILSEKNRSSIRPICSIWWIEKFLDDPTSRVFYPLIASHYWEWPLASLSIQPIGSIRRMENFIYDPTSRVSICSIRRMENIMLDVTNQ